MPGRILCGQESSLDRAGIPSQSTNTARNVLADRICCATSPAPTAVPDSAVLTVASGGSVRWRTDGPRTYAYTPGESAGLVNAVPWSRARRSEQFTDRRL